MKKTVLIIFFVLAIIGGCSLLLFFSLMPDLQSSSYTKEDLFFANYGDTLYLKKRIEANEEIVVISTSSSLKYDPDSSFEYIYDVSSSPLLYKQTADSLIIYTRTFSEVPTQFTSRVKILQMELSNSEMMNLIKDKSYTKLGLKKMD